MNHVKEQIHCRKERHSFQNADFSVAILDSGISLHPDLRKQILIFKDFHGSQKIPTDFYGHGTHVAGIISGSGEMSNGLYSGIAPRVPLVICKILDSMGDGSIYSLKEALEWVLINKEKYKIRILNISLSYHADEDKMEECGIQKLLLKLYSQNINIVCAAGNMGPLEGSLSELAQPREVICVGCYDLRRSYSGNGLSMEKRLCQAYSGRGPGKWILKKPDIVAPGGNIMSCNKWNEKQVLPYYTLKSGTSMSTAIVSGAMALALYDNGSLTAAELRQKLIYSAQNLGEPWTKQGWGMLNVERLLT